MADLTLEDVAKQLSELQDSHKALAEKVAAIPAGGSVSSLKKAEPVKKPEVCTETCEVQYKDGGSVKKGKFQLLHPTVHYQGSIIPASEAIKNADIVKYLVEGTWVGTKGNSKFVKEII